MEPHAPVIPTAPQPLLDFSEVAQEQHELYVKNLPRPSVRQGFHISLVELDDIKRYVQDVTFGTTATDCEKIQVFCTIFDLDRCQTLMRHLVANLNMAYDDFVDYASSMYLEPQAHWNLLQSLSLGTLGKTSHEINSEVMKYMYRLNLALPSLKQMPLAEKRLLYLSHYHDPELLPHVNPHITDTMTVYQLHRLVTQKLRYEPALNMQSNSRRSVQFVERKQKRKRRSKARSRRRQSAQTRPN